MKRPIKFRGRVIKDRRVGDGGTIGYGFFSGITKGNGLFENYWIRAENPIEPGYDYHEEKPIDPESLAQLCGYDKNGAEVYEGDILVDELEQEHVAEIYDRPNVLAALTLKK